MRAAISGIRSVGKTVKNFHKGDMGAKKAMAHQGRQAARSQLNSINTKNGMMGRGLTSMRNNKARTGLIVASGMGVAAATRNTGPGTSSGSTSLYRH